MTPTENWQDLYEAAMQRNAQLLAEKEAADAVIAETHNELARTYTRAYAAEAARDASQVDAARFRWLASNCVHTYGEEMDFELRFRYGHLFNETLEKAIDAELARKETGK